MYRMCNIFLRYKDGSLCWRKVSLFSVLQINQTVYKYRVSTVQWNNKIDSHKEAWTARARPEEIKIIGRKELKLLFSPSIRFPLFPSGIDCLVDLFRRSNTVKIPLLQPRGNSLQLERMRPRVSFSATKIAAIMEFLWSQLASLGEALG